jgi:hypothetical protein
MNASGKLTITCTAWRALKKNTLLGFATVRINELRLVIHDMAVHQKNGIFWAQPPSKPWFKDGALITDEDGKPKFSPIVEFDGREVHNAFSRAVVNAVLAYAPNAFGEGAA